METNIKGDFYCKYCGRHSTTKQGIRIHEKRCPSNPDRIISLIKNEETIQIPYNKLNEYLSQGWKTISAYYDKLSKHNIHNIGKLQYYKEDIIKYISKNEVDEYEKNGWRHGTPEYLKIKSQQNRKHLGKADTYEGEIERRRKISETMKNNPLCGGNREGSGRGHKGMFHGIYCDSSWELAFVVYYVEHNLYIERCNEKRNYNFNGENRVYIPDFKTSDGIIEIKGYSTKQWVEKLRQNPDIKVYYESDMQPYLEYVESKYGKKFWETLYDKKG